VGARMIDLKAPNPKAEKEDEEEWLFEKVELDVVAHEASLAVEKIEHKDIESLEDAREVESIYENEVRPTLQKYRTLSDLWTAQHFGLKIDAQIWRSLSDYVLKGVKQLKDAQKYVEKATEISEQLHFFHWELEFPEVFFEREEPGFDIVIGNPPYVRQETLGQELKSFLIPKFYNVGNGIADLYVYFYELGMMNLENDGLLSFITPNKWMERKYGTGLRQFLKKYWIQKIVNFSELRIFEEAATEPAIIVLRKIESDEDIEYLSVKSLEQAKKYWEYEFDVYPKGELYDSIWRFASAQIKKILDKFRKDTVPLSEYTNNGIYYGIKTGFNKAFIIDRETRDKLIKKNPNSSEILKPMVEGDDFGKWYLNHSGRYMVATGYDLDVPNLYPAVYEYLKHFENQLKKRQDQGKNWWNLRACTYYEEFDNPKIIYYHTALHHNFYLDTEGYYISANCYMIANADVYLQCVLNSSLFGFVKRYLFPAFGDAINGGRIRLDANKMINLPIKDIDEVEKKPFIHHAETMLTKSKELQKLKTMFTDILQSRLPIDTLSKKLEDWNELDWKQFEKELRKKGVTLSLEQEEDWRNYFEKKRREAERIQKEIDGTDKKIDEMVYQLYELTPEEIEIVNQNLGE
jgi:hypothetical protein